MSQLRQKPPGAYQQFHAKEWQHATEWWDDASKHRWSQRIQYPATNINEATGQRENVTLISTQLRNGDVFYMIAVAPQSEVLSFTNAFNTILGSTRSE